MSFNTTSTKSSKISNNEQVNNIINLIVTDPEIMKFFRSDQKSSDIINILSQTKKKSSPSSLHNQRKKIQLKDKTQKTSIPIEVTQYILRGIELSWYSTSKVTETTFDSTFNLSKIRNESYQLRNLYLKTIYVFQKQSRKNKHVIKQYIQQKWDLVNPFSPLNTSSEAANVLFHINKTYPSVCSVDVGSKEFQTLMKLVPYLSTHVNPPLLPTALLKHRRAITNNTVGPNVPNALLENDLSKLEAIVMICRRPNGAVVNALQRVKGRKRIFVASLADIHKKNSLVWASFWNALNSIKRVDPLLHTSNLQIYEGCPTNSSNRSFDISFWPVAKHLVETVRKFGKYTSNHHTTNHKHDCTLVYADCTPDRMSTETEGDIVKDGSVSLVLAQMLVGTLCLNQNTTSLLVIKVSDLSSDLLLLLSFLVSQCFEEWSIANPSMSSLYDMDMYIMFRSKKNESCPEVRGIINILLTAFQYLQTPTQQKLLRTEDTYIWQQHKSCYSQTHPESIQKALQYVQRQIQNKCAVLSLQLNKFTYLMHSFLNCRLKIQQFYISRFLWLISTNNAAVRSLVRKNQYFLSSPYRNIASHTVSDYSCLYNMMNTLTGQKQFEEVEQYDKHSTKVDRLMSSVGILICMSMYDVYISNIQFKVPDTSVKYIDTCIPTPTPSQNCTTKQMYSLKVLDTQHFEHTLKNISFWSFIWNFCYNTKKASSLENMHSHFQLAASKNKHDSLSILWTCQDHVLQTPISPINHNKTACLPNTSIFNVLSTIHNNRRFDLLMNHSQNSLKIQYLRKISRRIPKSRLKLFPGSIYLVANPSYLQPVATTMNECTSLEFSILDVLYDPVNPFVCSNYNYEMRRLWTQRQLSIFNNFEKNITWLQPTLEHTPRYTLWQLPLLRSESSSTKNISILHCFRLCTPRKKADKSLHKTYPRISSKFQSRVTYTRTAAEVSKK